MNDRERWHHHHDSDTRLVFCYDDDHDDDYDGLICDGYYNGPCRWHLAWGDVTTTTAQQPLLPHLEAVREWQTKYADTGDSE